MQKTPLGLTRLAPGESLTSDNFSFQDVNPKIIDGLLQYAAFRHRHDAHAALASPVADPVASTGTEGGTIPSDTAIYVGYTLTDADGGETTLNPDPVVVTTQGGLDTPIDGPELAIVHDAGTLVAGSYAYAITVTDAFGGETALGPPTTINLPTGDAANRITISGLAALVADSGGNGYRLWRRINGGGWGLVASGAADVVSDDGSLCADCKNVSPPIRTGRTNATNTLSVTVPNTAPNPLAASFSIYATLDGSFANPSLLGTYPIADLATAKVYTALDFIDGSPPEASLTMAGAPKVNADTDIINLRLREPVATSGDLPIDDNRDGDLRVALDDHFLYVWDDTAGAWGNVSTGEAASSQPHVIADEGVALTQRGTLNFVGDGVTVADEGGQTVVHITGGGSGTGGGHEIQDEGDALTQREILAFVGDGVTVTDDGTRTVVTIPGGGEGGTSDGNGFARQTLAVNGTGNKDIALPRGYRLLKVVATQAATRVRLYTRADRRAADAARSIDVAPVGADHGVILDAEIDANAPLTLTPALEGWNDDDAVADQGYAAINAVTAGTVTFTYVRTEVA